MQNTILFAGSAFPVRLNLALPRVKMDIKKSNLVYVDQFDAMTVQNDDPKMLR